MKNLTKRTRDKLDIAILWLKYNYYKVVMMMYALLCPVAVAAADDPPAAPSSTSAEDKWDTIIGFITPWIQRLGGVVILIGAIEFGLAWKNDDAEQKTKGMRTIIAGCIVWAVGLSANTFLN
ncbi:MAG: hypothetical protein K2H41_15435 [Acetatifactor sp.]|nr:hypothetical protein [Acetatifactor sp.]